MQLTERPATLQLYPSETYPTERQLEKKLDDVVTIKDMPQMATMVYEMYMQRIEAMKEEQKVKAEEVTYLGHTYSCNVFILETIIFEFNFVICRWQQ